MVTAQVPPARPSSSATGFILGRVVDATTGRPIGDAAITLSPLQPPSGDPSPLPVPARVSGQSALTSGDGRFLFRGLTAGAYGLSATAPGYLDGGLGQQRAGGRLQSLVLADGQRTGDATIRLWPEAVVSGVVTDDTGAPVPEIWVTLLRRDQTLRPGQLPATRGWTSLGARSDDEGRYRIGGIEPGEYVVAVPSRTVQAPNAGADAGMLQSLRASGAPDVGPTSRGVRVGDSLVLVSYDGVNAGLNALNALLPSRLGPDGRLVGYPATFHPGATTIASAATLTIKSGDDRTGIDIRLRPVSMVSVAGHVVGPDGPARHFAVHLIPAFAANSELEPEYASALATTDAAGAFRFLGVPPGQYVLKAWRRTQSLVTARDAPPAETTLWGEVPVTVGDAPVSSVSLVLQPGGVLAGRVQFQGAGPPPQAGPLQPPLSVAFQPPWTLAFGNRLGVSIAPTFEFTTLGLPPGKYVVNLPNQFSASLRGWFFESATLGGRDLTVIPVTLAGQRVDDIVITFSDRRSELTGRVIDDAGKPDPAAVVLVFPADYRTWIEHGLAPMAARAEGVSQLGTFAIAMKPGEYLAAAVDEATLQTWARPGTIEAIARRATPVSITQGESKRVELRRGSR